MARAASGDHEEKSEKSAKGEARSRRKDTADTQGRKGEERTRTSQGLDEDLHARATAKAEDEVESGLLLDVVVGQSATILELLAGEDEALLIRGDTLLLDLLLDGLDRVRRLDIKGNGLA